VNCAICTDVDQDWEQVQRRMDAGARCGEYRVKKMDRRRPPLSTLLISHPCFARHQTPPGHPERPERIRAVERILEHERFMALEREASPLAAVETLILAHPESYVRAIEEAAPRGVVRARHLARLAGGGRAYVRNSGTPGDGGLDHTHPSRVGFRYRPRHSVRGTDDARHRVAVL
jgi:hypothetical protein